MQHFVQVRGSKYIVRLFPHEVQDVEKVLMLLSKQNPSDHEVSWAVENTVQLIHTTWHARKVYTLLIFCTIFCSVGKPDTSCCCGCQLCVWFHLICQDLMATFPKPQTKNQLQKEFLTLPRWDDRVWSSIANHQL